jgi:hypothetical protein
MAYLRRQRIGRQMYLYIMESVRRGDKVTKNVLEYLGNKDQVTHARLKKALAYWRVKAKPGRGGK